MLEVAPSTYYAATARPPSARTVRDTELGTALVALWVKNYSVHGRRKLAKAARRAGLDAGRDQVARLMGDNGMRGATRAKKRFTINDAVVSYRPSWPPSRCWRRFSLPW